MLVGTSWLTRMLLSLTCLVNERCLYAPCWFYVMFSYTVIWIIMCKYHCESSPIDYFVNMHGPMHNIMLGKFSEKNKSNHEVANKGHKEPRVLMNMRGHLHKKGCCHFFQIEAILHTPNNCKDMLCNVPTCKQGGTCCSWIGQKWVEVY
jgi:hypothetical protein